MELYVACNWDINLPATISQFKEVTSLFGNTGFDPVGGGRIRRVIGNTTQDELEKYVKECHQYNLRFQYLLTSPSIGNREIVLEERKKIIDYIGWLKEIKVDTLSIGNPGLIDIVLKNFPDFPIKGSIFLDINNIRQAKYYQDIGLYSLVLPFYYSRDLAFLKKLRKNLQIEIQLFLNNTCLHFCPYSMTHAIMLGHGSQTYQYKFDQDMAMVDTCTLHCRQKIIHNPEELIKVNWILPEEIAFYEELGYTTFKLTERSASTETLVKYLLTFTRRKSTDNLIDLMSIKSPLANHEKTFDENVKKQNKALLFSKNIRPEQRMGIAIDVFKDAEPIVHTKELKTVLSDVQKIDCRRKKCTECNFCKKVAERSVYIPEKSKELNSLINNTLNAFYQSWK